ncbi:MAG TPA: PLP-dependent aspartate aminotransferase family protein [Planctomycetota bacterium]|nr:PLP-dependent aspartate aminotransferase family protein [Planctomycetota bacterium]
MSHGPGTRAVHDGEEPDRPTGALTTPVYRTSTFRFDTTDDLVEGAHGRRPGFYTRYGNPNFAVVERKFASLHGAEDALLFGSGMAALAAVILAHTRVGDRIVAVADLYGGTRLLLEDLAARGDVRTTYVPLADEAALAAALPGAKLLLAESVTNPVLRVLDMEALAAAARRAGAKLLVDNTFATPVGQRPLGLGVDLVWESATKALGGHSDLLGGVVAGSRALLGPVRRARQVYGGISDPETAWLLERGMKTLVARVERQGRTALELAGWLERHPAVARVWYPGLPSHPDHALARRLLVGGGAVVTFACRGGVDAARRLADGVRLVANAPSLGGVESQLSLPVFTSHAYLTPEQRAAVGVTDDLVRLSVGLEDLADLRADLDHALGSSA